MQNLVIYQKKIEMAKISKEDMEEYLLDREMTSIETFENFCNACDNFGTLECPYNGKVVLSTDWRNIGCSNFED